MSGSPHKALHHVQKTLSTHWVGDGFPVRNLLAYGTGTDLMQSPFLLLDYAGPKEFPSTEKRLGVGEHPHRGFETVTVVYDGEVEHRDSAGGGGKIGPGDVQWMTAAQGIVHEEFHGREFARRGGRFEMVQLWVNLPAKDKMNQAGYQAILNSDIPVAELPNGDGSLRVIAGEYAGHIGPARTHTQINMWDMQIKAGSSVELAVPDGHSALLVVLEGMVLVNKETPVNEAQIGMMALEGSHFLLDTTADAKVLMLSGEPIDEPVVGHGPFVMNTQAEIRQAMVDYQSGRMGHLS